MEKIYKQLEKLNNISINKDYIFDLKVTTFLIDYSRNEILYDFTMKLQKKVNDTLINKYNLNTNYLLRREHIGDQSYYAYDDENVSLSNLYFEKMDMEKREKKYVEKGNHQGSDDKGYYVTEDILKTENEILIEFSDIFSKWISGNIRSVEKNIATKKEEFKNKDIEDERKRLIEIEYDKYSKKEKEIKEEFSNKAVSINPKNYKDVEFFDVITEPEKYKLLGGK